MEGSKTQFDLFSKIQELQSLIKKESSFKKMCKLITLFNANNIVIIKNSKTLKKLNEECTILYKKKLLVLNDENKDKRIYELKSIKDKELADIWMYLNGFFVSLWENPKIVASLLINTKQKEIMNSLLPLLANNFYENILSQKFIQNNLLYVITLLLKYEIKTFCNLTFPKLFLSINSSCGYLLYELRKKRDFQIYLKDLIEEVIEILIKYPFDISFDIDKSEENIKKLYSFDDEFEIIDDKGETSEIIFLNDEKNERVGINPKDLEDIEKKYFLNSFPKDFFNRVSKTAQKHYLNTFNMFATSSMKIFKEKMDKNKYKNKIYFNYLCDFYIVTKFIETFLNKLIIKVNLVPYSIRIICKIISTLIQKKYQKITKIKRNIFICRFFFSALFWPTSKNSDNSWSVGNYLISEQIINNIEYIEKFFYSFIMGDLFLNKDNFDYAPFNIFFILKMDLLIKFIDELINVDLPEFINKTLEDDNYTFDYLKENENDGIINRSICFSIKDIFDIITNASKQTDNIFLKNKKLKIRYDNLMTDYNLNILCDLDSKATKENKVYYYLISDFLFTKKYEENIKMKKKMNYFTLEYIKNPENEEEKKINVINEAKNLLSGLLFHLIILTKENVAKNFHKDINKLLNELLNLSKYPHYSFGDDIITSWFAEPLINILPKLPKEITDNNCQKLIEGLINDVLHSLKDLYDYNSILNLINDEKIKYTQTTISFLDKNIKLISDINTYKKALDIIYNDEINIGFYIIEDNKNLKFEIYDSNSPLYNQKYDYNKYYLNFKPRIFKTISEFIQEFPDFNKLFHDLGDNLELQKIWKIPTFLKNYFDKINEYLNIKYKYIIDDFNNNKKNIYNNINDKLQKKLLTETSTEIKIFNKESIDIPNQLRNLFEEINENISTNTNLNYSINELIDIMKIIYNYVMEKLYDKLFPKIPTEEESNNFVKICLLSNSIELKDINEKYQKRTIRQSFLLDIKKYFKLFIGEKSPLKRIEAMNHIYEIIPKAIEFNEGKGEFGADDILPILTYCLIKAQPYRMNTILNYTLLYNPYSPYSKFGEESFHLNQLFQANESINIFYDNLKKE